MQGEDTTTVVLGEVVRFHVHEGVAGRSPSGKVVVDPVKLQPVSRLGGNTYALNSSLPRCLRGLTQLLGAETLTKSDTNACDKDFAEYAPDVFELTILILF
jgi:hypothetical protein